MDELWGVTVGEGGSSSFLAVCAESAEEAIAIVKKKLGQGVECEVDSLEQLLVDQYRGIALLGTL